jgi:hypothetical protein
MAAQPLGLVAVVEVEALVALVLVPHYLVLAMEE